MLLCFILVEVTARWDAQIFIKMINMTFIHYHKYKSIQYCIYGDGRGEVIQITNNNIFCIPDLDLDQDKVCLEKIFTTEI